MNGSFFQLFPQNSHVSSSTMQIQVFFPLTFALVDFSVAPAAHFSVFSSSFRASTALADFSAGLSSRLLGDKIMQILSFRGFCGV